ncbi:IclR family transcriptional regulator [Paucisalibacillus sp. EB02]|uniref:IclR family transcriptional regulator n=1 Tax=Paucisalibacillus sp. EB02 TaxID=1347087 RepID=UPI001E37315B|nr:IclR family transcriptional regulator [Paucisalibacillus sp. EB02]
MVMSNVLTVQSVDRALEIIEKLKDNPNGIGVTDLSVMLGVSKSTVHRLLMSLSQGNYVKKDSVTERYQLGLKFLELGDIVSENLDVRKLASPLLKELSTKTSETVHLVVMEYNEVVYIDKVESPETIRMYSRVGKRASMHCTGVGKVFLAHLPEWDVERIIKEKPMVKFTENTLITKEDLFIELRRIKSKGYAIDNEEHEVGVKCIAAPIIDYKGNIIAAVSVSAPIMRLNDEKFELMKQEVLYYSQKISELLGNFFTIV